MSKRQQGFTLVEMMVTLAVAIILIAVGVPMFTSVAANNRAAAQTNALVTALNLARSEAVGRATRVSVGPTSGGNWANGWAVFIDADSDDTVDSGEELRIWEAPAGSPTINASAATPVEFVFTGAAAAQLSFDLAQGGTSGAKRRCVTVTISGQIRTKKETAGQTWTCP